MRRIGRYQYTIRLRGISNIPVSDNEDRCKFRNTNNDIQYKSLELFFFPLC